MKTNSDDMRKNKLLKELKNKRSYTKHYDYEDDVVVGLFFEYTLELNAFKKNVKLLLRKPKE